jgi:putative Mg2+ transporter-C (MgtC) family protein
MVEITTADIIIRLGLATVLSALIGAEREWREKPAGIRTNVMVGLGSCLITLASVQMPSLWPEFRPIDPGRIAAQIISGIGFIGAGAIILRSNQGGVFGLTTAATLWVVAGLGMAIGFGFYVEALLTTALVFFTFLVLGRVVRAVREKRKQVSHAPDREEHRAHTDMAGVSAGDEE